MPRRGNRQDQSPGITPLASPMIPAVWYRPAGSLGTGIRLEAALEVMPFYLGRDCKLDRIACQVTIVGTAGAVIRLGIWADNGTGGYPGNLILDAGTVVGDSGTGIKEITIAQPMKAGLCWVGAVIQGAAGTRPQATIFNTQTVAVVGDPGTTPTLSAAIVSWTQTAVTGAFGAAFSTTKVFQGAAIVTYLRAST